MQDLDEVTCKLKQRLVPPTFQSVQSEQDIPVTCQSGHATLTSTRSGLSSLSSIHLLQSQRESTRTQETHESELLLTGSKDESSQGVDSGAFSVTQSSEKYQYNEPPDSQRSGSDRLDTFRLGTPRESTMQPEVDKSNITPRDHNNSDTGIHVAYTPRTDDFTPSSTGAFQCRNTPRELLGSGASPRDLGNHSVPSSDPTSLGFQYQGNGFQHSYGNSQRNGFHSAHGRSAAFANNGQVNSNSEQRRETPAQEHVEHDASDGEGDEKYYHRYRDVLDEQQKDDESDSEGEVGEVIMPRTLNDVSGKFGGIPGQSGIVHDTVGQQGFPGRMEYRDSPREFHHTDHTMPFDILGTESRSRSRSNTESKSNSGSKKTVSEAELSDFEEFCDKNENSGG